MAAVTILNDFGTPQNKVCQCFHCFPIYLSWSDGTGCHDHECWALSQLFHSPLSLSSRGSLVLCFLFSSFLCHKCAVICISEVTDIYLGNLDSSLCFIPASVQHFSWCTWHISEICLYIYISYIYDNIQPWHIHFLIWNQSVVSCPVLLLLDPHTDFSGGRSGGLVRPSLEEFSTDCCDPHSLRLWHMQ